MVTSWWTSGVLRASVRSDTPLGVWTWWWWGIQDLMRSGLLSSLLRPWWAGLRCWWGLQDEMRGQTSEGWTWTLMRRLEVFGVEEEITQHDTTTLTVGEQRHHFSRIYDVNCHDHSSLLYFLIFLRFVSCLLLYFKISNVSFDSLLILSPLLN